MRSDETHILRIYLPLPSCKPVLPRSCSVSAGGSCVQGVFSVGTALEGAEWCRSIYTAFVWLSLCAEMSICINRSDESKVLTQGVTYTRGDHSRYNPSLSRLPGFSVPLPALRHPALSRLSLLWPSLPGQIFSVQFNQPFLSQSWPCRAPSISLSASRRGTKVRGVHRRPVT